MKSIIFAIVLGVAFAEPPPAFRTPTFATPTAGSKTLALIGQQHQTAPRLNFPSPSPSYGRPGLNQEEPARYEFSYEVNDDQTGTNFGHTENRDGDNARGTYFALLPDGRLQRVTYTVDQVGGYQAQVNYEQTGHYPTPATPTYGRSGGNFGSSNVPNSFGSTNVPNSFGSSNVAGSFGSSNLQSNNKPAQPFHPQAEKFS